MYSVLRTVKLILGLLESEFDWALVNSVQENHSYMIQILYSTTSSEEAMCSTSVLLLDCQYILMEIYISNLVSLERTKVH